MSEGFGAVRAIQHVQEMPVYQLFYEIALRVERLSRSWTSDFRWLRSQMLRSSESVCANMTEGFYAQYSTEYLQSLFRCRREARETVTHLRYAGGVGVLESSVVKEVSLQYDEALRQLNNVIGSIERKIELRGKAKPRYGMVKDDGEAAECGSQSSEPLTINHQP